MSGKEEALFRVFPRKADGFYVDVNGNMFPLSENYTARVLIVNGYLDDEFDKDFPRHFRHHSQGKTRSGIFIA